MITYPAGNDRSYVTLQVAEYFPEGNESEITEYKQLWRSDFLKVISAFANTKGGVLHIGLDDRGKPVGLRNTKKLLEDIPNIIRNKLGIVPSIKLRKEDGKELIDIEVLKSSVPISFNGKFYVRSGSTVQELNGIILTDFLLSKSDSTWDEQIEENVTLDDLCIETIERFKRLAKNRIPSIVYETDISILLKKMNLMNEKGVTRAAVLLFGKDTQKYYRQAILKIGKFLSEIEIQSTDIVKGNLFVQLENALEILQLKYLLSNIHFEGLHRRDVLEYPYEALRESIINALIHRDYSGTAQTQIRVYPHKLVVMNQGMLPARVPASDLKISHLSIPGNTLLAETFYNAGFIEAWGYGTIKIKDHCLEQGLPEPDFEESAGAVKVTLYKNMLSEEYLRKLNLNKRQRKTLALTAKNDSITNRSYRTMHRVSESTALRDLKALVSWGVLYISVIPLKPVTYMLRTRCEPSLKILQKPVKIGKSTDVSSGMHETTLEQKVDAVLQDSSQNNIEQVDTLLEHSGDQCSVHDSVHDTEQVTGQVTPHVTEHVTEHVVCLLMLLEKEMSRVELMNAMQLTHRPSFVENYLHPALRLKLIEMTIPDKPRSVNQKYRLTSKGKILQKKLKRKQ